MKTIKNSKFRIQNIEKGFTLVELLIVIAILGVLAAGLLTVLDPLEQIQRARDATRISQVNQLGNAMTAYFVAHQAYPTLNITWLTTLVDAGELKQASIDNSSGKECEGWPGVDERSQNRFCYLADGTGSAGRAIVYVAIESKSQRAKADCGTPAGLSRGEGITWFAWSSVKGKAGLACSSTGITSPWNGGPSIDGSTFK